MFAAITTKWTETHFTSLGCAPVCVLLFFSYSVWDINAQIKHTSYV